MQKLVTPLGLAFHRERKRYRLGKNAGEAEQGPGLPALEFKLELRNRTVLGGGGNLALIDRKFDVRPVMRQLVDFAGNAGLECPGESRRGDWA
jgi:hypothetical protein